MLCIPAGHSLECFLILYSVKTRTWFFYDYDACWWKHYNDSTKSTDPERGDIILLLLFSSFYFFIFSRLRRVCSRLHSCTVWIQFLPIIIFYPSRHCSTDRLRQRRAAKRTVWHHRNVPFVCSGHVVFTVFFCSRVFSYYILSWKRIKNVCHSINSVHVLLTRQGISR